MKKLILLLLLSCSVGAHAAAPVISCAVPSGTSGTAPYYVAVDCTATTGGTHPFADVLYEHSFGDAGAGKWAVGANTSASKNYAAGGVAGHIYETAGTYTITSKACNASGCQTQTHAITVAAANTTFSQANTSCFYQALASGDCPNGGTETQSSDFDASLSACIGTTKRCLFQRGSSFPSDTIVTFSAAGPTLVGAYGSSSLPKPIVTSNNTHSILANSGTSVTALTLMDLDIRGVGALDTNACFSMAGNASNVTFLRFNCSNIGRGIIVVGAVQATYTAVQDSTLLITNPSSSTGGVGIFGGFVNSAIQGNTIGPFAGGEHNIRIQPAYTTVIAHNTVGAPGQDGSSGKQVIAVRATDHVTGSNCGDDVINDARYFIVSDNLVSGLGSSNLLIQVEPASKTQSDWICDGIVERNAIVLGSTGATAVEVEGANITVRNNIADATNATNSASLFYIKAQTTTTTPASAGNTFYNNTCYFGSALATVYCVRLETINAGNTITGTLVSNNLSYGPIVTTASVVVALPNTGTITGTVGASGTHGNSSDAQSQIGGTSPLFDNVASFPLGFRIGAGSYAINGTNSPDTIYPATTKDFYNCLNNAGHVRAGAFNPRVQSQCASSGGQ